MVYLLRDLLHEVFDKPYAEGYRHLRILSGYASPVFLEYILMKYPDLSIELTIGMVSHDGISMADHQMFQNLIKKYEAVNLKRDFPRTVEVDYQIARPGNHTKIYYWSEGTLPDSVSGTLFELPSKIYIGSANFSYNAFFSQKELLVESTHRNIDEVFENLQTMSCIDPLIESNVTLYKVAPRKKTKVTLSQNKDIQDKKQLFLLDKENSCVELSFITKKGTVPDSSGLNWGQRQGRNKNQAYIAVSKPIHTAHPTFFPDKKVPFVIHTDDGETMLCVMAQDNRKAIHTMENNSIMGAYFRKRLGLQEGEFVKVEHLKKYGRTHVHLYKIDDETYFLDFSV